MKPVSSFVRSCACGALALLLSACTSSPAKVVPPAPDTGRDGSTALSRAASLEARIESSIDKTIHGSERQRVKRAMLGLPKYVQAHITRAFRYVRVEPTASGLSVIGNKEGFDKSASLLLPLPGTTNQYAAPSGKVFSAPAFGRPRPASRRTARSVYVNEYSGQQRRERLSQHPIHPAEPILSLERI